MRTLLTASALLLAIGATPGLARDYPWCARTPTNGFNPSCDFTTRQQCLATVSGQGGFCAVNPILAFDQAGSPQDPRVNKRRLR